MNDTDIYHAAAGLRPWHGALGRVAEQIGAQGGRLVGVDSGTGAVLFNHDSDGASVESMREPGLPLEQLLRGADGTWHFHQDKYGMRREASGPGNDAPTSHKPGQHTASAKLLDLHGETMLITFRAELGAQGFAAGHRPYLKSIIGQWREAAAIYRQMRKLIPASFTGIGLLHHLHRPALVVAAGGAVSLSNTAADRYLANAKTLFIAPQGLAAYDKKTDSELAGAIDAMVASASQGSVPRRRVVYATDRNGGRSAALSLRALGSAEGVHQFGAHPRLLLVVHEHTHHADPDVLLWETAFELTPAQSRVATEMFRGCSVEEAAASLNIAPTTVKSHLKELYWKTGTSRQTQLILALVALQSS